MTHLRRAMLEELQRRNYAKTTVYDYLKAIERFARFFHASPDQLNLYETDPTQPIGSWKTAWKTARKAAIVSCRFHDLRHSAVTRLLEAGVSFPIVASLLGWSPSTTTKMAKRYGHIGSAAHRMAVAALDPSSNARDGGTKEGTVTAEPDMATAVNA